MKSLVKPSIPQLNGIKKLTDETGMLQHTKYSTIDRKKGYTTDDNARALIATLMYYTNFKDPDALQLANTYLTFLLHMQKTDGQFHNLLGFDRRFQDEVGSEDCTGRALWASGYTLNSDAPHEMKNTSKEIFDRGLPSSHNFTSPRAKAFTILGLYHYHKAFSHDENIQGNIETFTNKLIDLYRSEADDNWRWFESYLTYSNPRLPQALFAAFEVTRQPMYLQIAQRSFDFLIKIQIIGDIFIPIGTMGWFQKNGERALYDQQPIEASCMVEAALMAFNSTGNEAYRNVAQIAFEWYHGRNTQGVTLYNPKTWTCYDGITAEGINLNQGAESILSYYISYLKVREDNLL